MPIEPLPADLTGSDARILQVVNKVDVVRLGLPDAIELSAVTGEGVQGLLDVIAERAGARSKESALITRTRHRAMVQAAADACRDFLGGDQTESELRAEDLRRAAHALGKLTGRVDVEEVLGEIFGRFCIGK